MFLKRNMKFYWACFSILSDLTRSVSWIFWWNIFLRLKFWFSIQIVFLFVSVVFQKLYGNLSFVLMKTNPKNNVSFLRKASKQNCVYNWKRIIKFLENPDLGFLYKNHVLVLVIILILLDERFHKQMRDSACIGHYFNILGWGFPQLNAGFSS